MDETFLEHLMLVFMDLPTGYLLLEEVAEDRTYATWKALVDERLKALGTEGWYRVSDRATVLIPLAEKGLECLSIPDVFPVVHESVKSYALAIGRRLRQAQQALQHAEEVLARQRGLNPATQDEPAAKAHVAACQAKVQQWTEAHSASRQALVTLSLTFHPFDIATSRPQTSAQVASQ